MRRFLPAIAASVALVLASPFIGQLRAALQDAFPQQYRAIIATAVFGSIGVATLAALWRIRSRRALRYGLIAAALIVGSSYAAWAAGPDPAVNAVERFHFVEYGAIAMLFYAAWRPVGDASLLVLPGLAGFLVGTCEEWLQWFVPSRVGELRDVLLNLWAIICGVLFALALDPPERLTLSLRRDSWTRIKRVAAGVVLVFAGFVNSVHLGYRIDDPAIGSFRSTYTADQLVALERARADEWRQRPPLTWTRLSREDQYLTEGVTHVRARNKCWDGGDVSCAWHENLVLERYFAPVVDTPSYWSPSGFRWPAEQRADAEERASGGAFASAADETPIYVVSKPVFWAVVAAITLLLLWPTPLRPPAR